MVFKYLILESPCIDISLVWGDLAFTDLAPKLVAERLHVILDFRNHQVGQRLRVLEDLLESFLFLLQFLELLLDLDQVVAYKIKNFLRRQK